MATTYLIWQLITPWVFFRYMVVGLYVGFATVGVFGYWYTAYDWSEYGHPLISVSHLSNWGKCSHFGEMAEFTSDPCAPHLPPADAPRARRLLTAAAV